MTILFLNKADRMRLLMLVRHELDRTYPTDSEKVEALTKLKERLS